mmetsp:Transcript_13730/g.52290  ORF Transcript_13730/g.52290 Transcript_13730/m.52290 type:complete len:211 (-) Transcript_13730:341-973(-)
MVPSARSWRMSTLRIFSEKRSCLLRKSIMAVLSNQRELAISSNRSRASSNRFLVESSFSTWSYSDREATKSTAVTSSKQWIHFLRSFCCPPTSNMTNLLPSISNSSSTIPSVFTRSRSMSSVVAVYPGAATSAAFSKKYAAESSSWKRARRPYVSWMPGSGHSLPTRAAMASKSSSSTPSNSSTALASTTVKSSSAAMSTSTCICAWMFC